MNLPRVKSWVSIAVLAVLAVGVMAGDALACPTCKEGISGSDPVSVARASGYFYSIIFMMSMPFVIVGTFGGAAYLSIRRARQQQIESNDMQAAK
jgi:predicted cation transporter